MGDKTTLAMAKKELEELYLGVPDDSVNLTFQDLAEIGHQENKKSSPKMEVVSESSRRKFDRSPSPMAKLPSLDFSRGLEASFQSSSSSRSRNLHHHRLEEERDLHGLQGHVYRDDHHYNRDVHHHANGHGHHQGGHYHHDVNHHANAHSHHQGGNHHHDVHHHTNVHDHHHGDNGAGFRHGMAMDHRSFTYDDMSHVSGMSVAYGQERGGRRRPGIPHSNICAVCSNYIYIFRHRCLVCGRVYCRQCVSIGMGEMTEGRKCIECLGRRFSQRYIHKAGNLGCCMGYSSTVKQQELIWAEKGPRRSGDNRYSTQSQTTPTRQHSPSNPPSFVMNSPYSPTSHHSLPL